MQTNQWTNQNLKQIHVAVIKNGEMHAIGFGFTSDWLRKLGEMFLANHISMPNAKPKQSRNYFPHSIENRS